MAFKMKAGKEGPMQKNFGSAMNITIAQKENLPENLVKIIQKKEASEGSAKPKLKDNAPMMRMDPSAMKAMGKPSPVKMNTPKKHSQGSHEDHHSEGGGRFSESTTTVENQNVNRRAALEESLQKAIAGRDQLLRFMQDPGFESYDEKVKQNHKEGVARFNADIERIKGLLGNL
jgi:hypothetical protein